MNPHQQATTKAINRTQKWTTDRTRQPYDLPRQRITDLENQLANAHSRLANLDPT